MKKGDTVLLDGVEEVELKWKGGSLALVKPEDKEEHGVDIRRLSEKGTVHISEIDKQTDIENLF